MRPRDWKTGRMQRRDDAIFTIDGVRRRQQLAGWFPAQNEFASIGRGEPVRRVGLSAFEMLERGDAKAEHSFERARIDAMPLFDRLRADELLEHGAASLT